MATTSQGPTSEWAGLRGRIGAWYLSSPLRRVSELFLGDLRSRYLQKIEGLLKGDEVVLDVGAGSGYFALPIAERLKGGRVICLDLSPEMLAALKGRAAKKNLSHKIEARLGDIYRLELGDETVDLATSNGVFHELSQPQQALGEIWRVLRPGGHVVITDFRDTAVGRRIGSAHRQGDHGPFSPEELRRLLEQAGFAGVEAEAVRHWVLAVGRKPG